MKPEKPPLLLATRNQGKVVEIEVVLEGCDYRFVSLADLPNLPDPEENGSTFAANARLKAEYYQQKTGLTTIADDSGLVVEALGGQPGVRSARFAPTDPERIRRLLELMRPFPDPTQRTASFVCAVCLCQTDGRLFQVEGKVDGWISLEPVGMQGFGYDPIFYYPPLRKTFAEMSPEEKNRVSHRSVALSELRRSLHPQMNRPPGVSSR